MTIDVNSDGDKKANQESHWYIHLLILTQRPMTDFSIMFQLLLAPQK